MLIPNYASSVRNLAAGLVTLSISAVFPFMCPSERVYSLHAQDPCPLNNLHPLLAADTVSDSGGVFAAVHEQELELGEVVDEELLVAGRDHVSSLLVGTVTDFRHGKLALESTTNLYDQYRAPQDVPI